MARSIRKGPHIDMKLLKKVHKMEEASSKSVIKTWARNSIILPDFVGHTFAVHMAISLYLFSSQKTWLAIN